MIVLKEVITEAEYTIAGDLFREYASQLDIDLAFQNFNKELETLHSQYSRPSGMIVIAFNETQTPLGCFGIRKFEGAICELKRMYLRKEARGLGMGSILLQRAIEIGKELGYEKMRLDTLPSMNTAIKLYKKAGFYEIEPYRFNPVEGTKYFEIML
jgi:ribosomal protein S18 acetylase RimI-like enzyme